MADSNELINPSRIRVARKRRGLTVTAFASKIGSDVKTAIAYEKGTSTANAEALSNALDFPPSFFYGDDLEFPEHVSFRSLSRMTARKRDMALSQGALALGLGRWLENKFELPPCSLPDLSREISDIEASAASLRRVWGLGDLPIRNMVHLLEANGVRVFSLSIEAREVDAFALWSGDNPVILLNTFKSAERSRFDAAHELAHLVLHRHGGTKNVRDAEIQADAFASAFLMPKASVEANAPKFPSVAELIRLKHIWGTSVSAVNYRLHKLGIISDWHYRSLCIQLSNRGYRLHEPQEAARESSALLPQLLIDLYRHDKLTRSSIARELGYPVAELNQLLFGLTISEIESASPKRGNPSLIKRPSGLSLVDQGQSTCSTGPLPPSSQSLTVCEG